MIVSRIQGGLGNQLFQYVFGLYLAEKHNAELLLDFSSYVEDPLREFMLDRYSIEAVAPSARVRKLCPSRYGGWGRRNVLRLRRRLRSVRETPFGFDEKFLKTGDHAYLDGYWQSERFFPGLGERVRTMFQPIVPLSGETLVVARQMARQQSASLHVRRTDYLTLEYTTVCSQAYYQRCVDHLLSNHSGLHLFVFSDDIAWCQRELRFPCPTTFVSHNGGSTAHEDLWLMSQCRHHIVANSSFSWWGARLGIDPSGETLAPDPWFNASDVDGSFVVPPAWQKVLRAPERSKAA